MTRQKNQESLGMKLLCVLFVGCIAAALNFFFAWEDELPKGDLFLLQAMGAITGTYMALYALAIVLIDIFPSKRERYRRLRESLPHRKPR